MDRLYGEGRGGEPHASEAAEAEAAAQRVEAAAAAAATAEGSAGGRHGPLWPVESRVELIPFLYLSESS